MNTIKLLALALLKFSSLDAQINISSRVSSSNDDAEERLNDNSMYLNSSDLELVFEGSTEQLVGMRFTNITVPPGKSISNAYIEFETDETDSGTTNLTFRGEDIDDASTFTSSTGNISNRPLTSATVNWNNVPAWNTVSQKHSTPDLSSIIQEIVDRTGWSSGNDIVIIVSGTGERTAESYNGESANAPILHITYSDDPPTPPDTSLCYVINENSNGLMYSWDDTGTNNFIGTLGASAVEAMTKNGDCDEVYVTDAGNFGSVNLSTGAYTFISSLGTVGNSVYGNHNIADVDGLAIDALSGYIYGSERRDGVDDLLFLIDPGSGQVVYDAFGLGNDYVTIPGGLNDIDDLAFSPCDYELYAITTDEGNNAILVTIDLNTGQATPVVTLSECDSEGMTFDEDCNLYVSIGEQSCNPAHVGSIMEVNMTTGDLTEITNVGGDVEAIVCCVASPAPSPIAAVLVQTNALCSAGGADAEVQPSGGTGGYVYLWSDGGTTRIRTGLANGTYTITVTDYSGNSATDQLLIETYGPSCSITEDMPDCDISGNGQATVTASGGDGSYTYLWDNGETTATAVALTGGLHTVTVTEGTGCTGTCDITINAPGTILSCTANQIQNVSCEGINDGQATVNFSGGFTGGYRPLWDNAEMLPTAMALTIGTHTVTVTDSGGCTTYCSVEIFSDPNCCFMILSNRFIMYKSISND